MTNPALQDNLSQLREKKEYHLDTLKSLRHAIMNVELYVAHLQENYALHKREYEKVDRKLFFLDHPQRLHEVKAKPMEKVVIKVEELTLEECKIMLARLQANFATKTQGE